MRTILKFLPMMALVGCMAVSCDDDNDYDFGDGTDNGTDIETPTDNGTQIDTIIGESVGNGDFILGHDANGNQNIGWLGYGEIYYDRDDTDFSSPQLRLKDANPYAYMDEDGNYVSNPSEDTPIWNSIANFDLEIEPNQQVIEGSYFFGEEPMLIAHQAGHCTGTDLNLVAEWGYDSTLGVYYPAKTLHMDNVSGEFIIRSTNYNDTTEYIISLIGEGESYWATQTSATSNISYEATTNSDNEITVAYSGTLATVIGGSEE